VTTMEISEVVNT